MSAAEQGREGKCFNHGSRGGELMMNGRTAVRNWQRKTGYEKRSDGHVVRGTLRSGDAALVINLSGGDVLVAE